MCMEQIRCAYLDDGVNADAISQGKFDGRECGKRQNRLNGQIDRETARGEGVG